MKSIGSNIKVLAVDRKPNNKQISTNENIMEASVYKWTYGILCLQYMNYIKNGA